MSLACHPVLKTLHKDFKIQQTIGSLLTSWCRIYCATRCSSSHLPGDPRGVVRCNLTDLSVPDIPNEFPITIHVPCFFQWRFPTLFAQLDLFFFCRLFLFSVLCFPFLFFDPLSSHSFPSMTLPTSAASLVHFVGSLSSNSNLPSIVLETERDLCRPSSV